MGVNRIGSDGNGLDYSGDSLALAADGTILIDCENRRGLFSTTLSAESPTTYRRKFPVLEDTEDFTLG